MELVKPSCRAEEERHTQLQRAEENGEEVDDADEHG